MYKILYSTILALLFLTANTLTFAQKMPWDFPPNPLDDLVVNGIVVPLNTDEKTLLEKLGQPQNIERIKVKNPYYDFDDIAVTYKYHGLEISYYHHMHPENGWKKIASIEVTSNEYPIKHGISIGMPLSEIERRFGQLPLTKWESDGYLYITYARWDSVHDQVNFVLQDNILKKFVWSDWP